MSIIRTLFVISIAFSGVSIAFAQSTFDAHSGVWAGVGQRSGQKVLLEVAHNGNFSVSSGPASASGVAKLKDGEIVLVYGGGAANLTLKLSGNQLNGTKTHGSSSEPIKFTRTK